MSHFQSQLATTLNSSSPPTSPIFSAAAGLTVSISVELSPKLPCAAATAGNSGGEDSRPGLKEPNLGVVSFEQTLASTANENPTSGGAAFSSAAGHARRLFAAAPAATGASAFLFFASSPSSRISASAAPPAVDGDSPASGGGAADRAGISGGDRIPRGSSIPIAAPK